MVLARSWLQSQCQSVKQFNTLNVQKGKKDFQVIPDSYRSIATFLSKNGKAVIYLCIKNYKNKHSITKTWGRQKILI